MDYASLICSTDDCRSEVEEVIEAYRELLGVLEEFKGYQVSLDYSKTPLMVEARSELDGIRNRLISKLRERYLKVVDTGLQDVPGSSEGVEGLVSILARRVFYEIVGERANSLDWVNGKCPVCGLTPVIGLMRRREGEIFSRDIMELRCICGFTKEYDALKCPSCETRGRENFEYLILGRITYRICRKCGHILGITREMPQANMDLVSVTILYGITLVLGRIVEERSEYTQRGYPRET